MEKIKLFCLKHTWLVNMYLPYVPMIIDFIGF